MLFLKNNIYTLVCESYDKIQWVLKLFFLTCKTCTQPNLPKSHQKVCEEFVTHKDS